MDKLALCIQCKDINSGTIGCFGYSPEHKFKALTPIFFHFGELAIWLTKSNYIIDYHNLNHPVGFAEKYIEKE